MSSSAASSRMRRASASRSSTLPCRRPRRMRGAAEPVSGWPPECPDGRRDRRARHWASRGCSEASGPRWRSRRAALPPSSRGSRVCQGRASRMTIGSSLFMPASGAWRPASKVGGGGTKKNPMGRSKPREGASSSVNCLTRSTSMPKARAPRNSPRTGSPPRRVRGPRQPAPGSIPSARALATLWETIGSGSWYGACRGFGSCRHQPRPSRLPARRYRTVRHDGSRHGTGHHRPRRSALLSGTPRHRPSRVNTRPQAPTEMTATRQLAPVLTQATVASSWRAAGSSSVSCWK